jgi:hypothetical protein
MLRAAFLTVTAVPGCGSQINPRLLFVENVVPIVTFSGVPLVTFGALEARKKSLSLFKKLNLDLFNSHSIPPLRTPILLHFTFNLNCVAHHIFNIFTIFLMENRLIFF